LIAFYSRKPPYDRYKSGSSKKPQRPVNAERIRKFIIQLFVRDDGDGVDWSSPIIAGALFKLAFYAIDRMPNGQRRYKLLYRVEEVAYDRLKVFGPEIYVEAGPPPPPPPPDWSEGPEAHFSDVVQ
jgi:hypothetical protein